LALPSWRSVPQHGLPGTAVVEEASVVVASMVAVVLAVAVVSTEEVSVAVSTAVAFAVARWLPDTLEAESAAAEVELALAQRTFQAALRTLPAPGPGSLHLVIHHPSSLSMMDGPLDPLLPTSQGIVPQWLQQRIHPKHFRNAE